MIEAVNRVYSFLRHPENLMQLGAAARWNRPELDPNPMRTVERRTALARGEDPAQVWAIIPSRRSSKQPCRSRTERPSRTICWNWPTHRSPTRPESPRAKAVMIAAANVWTWDRLALDDLDFIPGAHGD